MGELKIPYALLGGTDNEILPEAAPHGGRYDCPECRGRVIRRGGRSFSKRRAHFSHHGSDHGNCCWGSTGESQEHRRACHEVKAAIIGAIQAQAPVYLDLECPLHIRSRHVVKWVPQRGGRIDINRRLSTTDRRPDIVVIAPDGEIDLAIEIKHTHAVNAGKASDYAVYGFRWVEINTASASNLAAEAWHVISHGGNFGQFPCCANERQRRTIAALRPVGAGIPVPPRFTTDSQISDHGGSMVFHPAFGLVPRNITARQKFLESHFGNDEQFRLRGCCAIVRRHPLVDDACVVTLGPLQMEQILSAPVASASVIDAELSEWAEGKGYRSTYFAIPNLRLLSGNAVVETTRQFFRDREVSMSYFTE